jgi:hypothetical protein
MIVEFEFLGKTFRVEGTFYPGDRGSRDEPPEPAEFDISYLSVKDAGAWVFADWLLDSDLGSTIVDYAIQAAQREVES